MRTKSQVPGVQWDDHSMSTLGFLSKVITCGTTYNCYFYVLFLQTVLVLRSFTSLLP